MQFLNKKDTTLLIKFTIIAIVACYIGTELMHDYHMNKYKQNVITNNY